jgi:hypothetical protein
MKKITIALLLLSQLSLFAQDYKFGKVSKAELEETFYPLDSTADAAYLYRGRSTYYKYNEIRGEFDVVTEVHNRIKIYTKEGFDKATVNIFYYKPEVGNEESFNSLKGFTFNKNVGKITKDKLLKVNIFQEKKNKYWSVKKITMPNIKIGSVIDIKYKIISPYYNKIDDFEFQFDIPVKTLDYSVEIPEYYKFNKLAKGFFSIKPIVVKKSGSFRFTTKDRDTEGFTFSNKTSTSFKHHKIDFMAESSKFNAKNIPALKDNEPFVSSIQNYRGGMSFELTQTNFLNVGGGLKYYSTTWENVTKQIFKSSRFGGELLKKNYYKQDLEQLLINAKTDQIKLLSIFNFVKKQVKWNGYNTKYTNKGVRKAYKDREGNVAEINLLLTSMLRSAGLDANPVLVSTRINGLPLFPTLEGFNYVISIVEFADGSKVLLDASEKYNTPNVLPIRALNWNGRKVTKEGVSSWVKLTSPKYALEENKIIIKISDKINVKGLMSTKYSNLNALNYRKKHNHIKKEDLIIGLEEKYNFDIDGYKIVNKYELEKPIVRSVKFISEDLIEKINGKLYIEPLLFLSQHKNPFKLVNRKFPVDFGMPWKDKNIVSIQIPDGYKVERLPESLAVGLPDNLGVFRYKVSQTGNKISTTSILQFNEAVISSTYYAALKGFYGQMVEKQSEKIVLVKE